MITKYQIITIRNSVLVTIKRSNRKTLGLEVKRYFPDYKECRKQLKEVELN